jgi:hypothetical protein
MSKPRPTLRPQRISVPDRYLHVGSYLPADGLSHEEHLQRNFWALVRTACSDPLTPEQRARGHRKFHINATLEEML